ILYIPLLVLFVLAATAYYQHARTTIVPIGRLIDQSNSVRIPFELSNGAIVDVYSEAAAAGIVAGDRLLGIGGRELSDDNSMMDAIGRFRPGDKVTYTIGRKDA